MARRLGIVSLCLMVGCGVAAGGSGEATGIVDASPDTLAQPTVCTTTCDGKTCGDDGCGGLCGKCGPTEQCAAGQCVEEPIACVPADTASCGHVVSGISLVDPGQTTAAFTTFGECTADGETFPGAEVALMFGATDDARVTLSGFAGATVFVLEDDGSGCNRDSQCVARVDTGDAFSVTKGKTYYFVLERVDASGPFTVDVACCTPSCDDKTCGDDGCGGSCGTCPDGQLCGDGACLEVSTVAKPAAELVCGYTTYELSTANALTATDAFDAYPGCSAETYDSPEVATTFWARETSVVTLSTGMDTFILEASDQDWSAGACLAAIHGSGRFRATAGHLYWLVFERPVAPSGPITDPFDVDAACCVPQCDGSTCDDGCGGTCGLCQGGYCDGLQCVPGEPSCTPQKTVGCGETVLAEDVSTYTASNAFSSYSCPEAGGADFSATPEFAYRFISAIDQRVSISQLVAWDSDPLIVAVIEDRGQGCATSPTSCTTTGWQSDQYFDAKAGATYYIVWEASFSGSAEGSGAATFSIACCPRTCAPGVCGVVDGCGGVCGCDAATQKCGDDHLCEPLGKGEHCAEPFVIDTTVLPVTVGGDLEHSGRQFSGDRYLCDSSGVSDTWGRDHVYAFTAPEDAVYAFTTQLGASWAQLYVMSECVGLAEADAACAHSVSFGEDVPAGKRVNLPISAGQTVYIVVDAYSVWGATAYTLTVSAPCHPTCDGVHCGKGLDGCGGACDCGEGSSCTLAGLCQSEGPGDSCATALPVDAQTLPFVIQGSTSKRQFDLYGLWCGAEYIDGRPDVVYTFTPPFTATYAISSVGTQGQPMASVRLGCGTPSESCVDDALSHWSDNWPMWVALEAGVPVDVVVTMVGGPPGPFSLTIGLAP